MLLIINPLRASDTLPSGRPNVSYVIALNNQDLYKFLQDMIIPGLRENRIVTVDCGVKGIGFGEARIGGWTNRLNAGVLLQLPRHHKLGTMLPESTTVQREERFVYDKFGFFSIPRKHIFIIFQRN